MAYKWSVHLCISDQQNHDLPIIIDLDFTIVHIAACESVKDATQMVHNWLYYIQQVHSLTQSIW